MNKAELKFFLDEKVEQFNRPDFINQDPIQVPHQFSKKEDMEIAGFIAATIAWGQRTTILKNANRIVEFMEHQPFYFLKENEPDDFYFDGFVHRTFNATDLQYFLTALKRIYSRHGGLERAFSSGSTAFDRLKNFRELFFGLSDLQVSQKTLKHVSTPAKNSACKRLNMFLRWMVREDKKGVDLGIWNTISKRELMLPLDVHTANVSRKLGLLKRKQNDWKAVHEVTTILQKFDDEDPIKYDFALFGLGAIDKF